MWESKQSDPGKFIGVYLTHHEVAGERASISSVIHRLSRFNRDSLLRILARINSLVAEATFGPRASSIQVSLQKQFYDKAMQAKIEGVNAAVTAHRGYAGNVDSILFHHHQLLLMLKFALISCPAEGGIGSEAEWTEEECHLFGDIALRVNDLTGPEAPSNEPDLSAIRRAFIILSDSEITTDINLMALVGRAAEMWLELPHDHQLTAAKDYIPFAERFLSHYGVSLSDFIKVLCVMNMRAIATQASNGSDELPVLNVAEYVGKHINENRLSVETFERSLRIVSLTPDKLASRILMEPSQSFRLDMTQLRRFPVLDVQAGIHLMYDAPFMAKYLMEGIYWCIMDALSSEEKAKFQSFYGKVFAAYIEFMFRSAFDAKKHGVRQVLSPKPMFTKGNAEVCDIFVESGDESWVLIEVKGSFLTTRSKYAGNFQEFKSSVDDKYGSKKGGGQLAKSIAKLLRGEGVNVASADLARCKNIYPVLVVSDTAVSGPGMRQYLDAEFRKELGDRPSGELPIVRELTVLSAQDVEVYSSLSSRHALHYALASFQHWPEKEWGFYSFAVHQYPRDIDVESTSFNRRFDTVTEEVMDLFRKSTVPQNEPVAVDPIVPVEQVVVTPGEPESRPVHRKKAVTRRRQ